MLLHNLSKRVRLLWWTHSEHLRIIPTRTFAGAQAYDRKWLLMLLLLLVLLKKKLPLLLEVKLLLQMLLLLPVAVKYLLSLLLLLLCLHMLLLLRLWLRLLIVWLHMLGQRLRMLFKEVVCELKAFASFSRDRLRNWPERWCVRRRRLLE